MLHTLLPPHKLDHLAEWLPRILAPEKEPPASLEQHRQILHVSPEEVVQTDLKHVENNVWRDDAELREVG